MSKPRIFAHCKAGCEWETVHRDDFLKSASIIAVEKNGDGHFILEVGKTYKIKRESLKQEWGFSVAANIKFPFTIEGETEITNASVDLSLPDPVWDNNTSTSYDEYLKIRVIDVYGNGREDGTFGIYVVAECNGNITHIETALSASSQNNIYFLSDGAITVYGATECFLINEDATITLPNKEEIVAEVIAALPVYNGEVTEV